MLGVALLVSGASGAPIGFNRDVRPILSENCFHCHGPDKSRRKANLRLDRREDAVEAGAFEPSKPESSEAIRRIFAAESDEMMPPGDSHRSLTPAQKDTLKRWVAEGARYEPHWAFVAPQRPAVPAIKSRSMGRNPIDAFVLARLEAEGLSPAPEADRRTLLRRLSLDITGLPPSPADVEAFVATRERTTYDHFVKRYLASPHYGERLAIQWLDLVRYADTVGFHGDVSIEVWPYRDYVIGAFNRNLPFDQFTREQLAGDLLPDSTVTQRIASGYNRLHKISIEGGIQDKEYLAKYSADRVRTTSATWMAATIGCAECHDHKFDPFTAKDFYRFAALFSDLKEKGAYNLGGGFTRENLSQETIFSSIGEREQFESLTAEIARLRQIVDAISNEQMAASRAMWEESIRAAADAGTLAWSVHHPKEAVSTSNTPLAVETDNSIVPGGKNPQHDTYIVTLSTSLEQVTGLRIESLFDPRFPGNDIARGGAACFISEVEVLGKRSNSATFEAIKLAGSRVNVGAAKGHPVSSAIDGNPSTSFSFNRRDGSAISLHFTEPWTGGLVTEFVVKIHHSKQHPYQHLGRFRLSLHTLPAPDAHPHSVPKAVLAALRVPIGDRKAAQQKSVESYFREIAVELAVPRAELARATDARDRMVETLPSMPVSKSVKPRTMRVLPRGNWMDDSGEIVEPGVPEFMRQPELPPGVMASRLDFANWLMAPENPLTARTFVNRLWRLYFGAGLTRTLDDLGSQGEWPSHPDLLDWLAVEFRESGWNVKHIVELIVTSETYRQSSVVPPALEQRDPYNRLLARQSRFRLDAELVRDNALAISGLLVPKVGGPCARPYQPEGYYAPMSFPRREYVADLGEGLYRRGVYTHWQRTFLHPSLAAFDAPAREECTANRIASNTPLQALALLNDTTYVEAARVFAAKILTECSTDITFKARLHWAFVRALSRPPTSEEVRLLHDFHAQQLGRYRRDTAAARKMIGTGASPVVTNMPSDELAAWTAVTRALLNLHETITRY